MKNSEYWRDRLIEIKKRQIHADNSYLGALEVEYKMALRSLTEDIETWYARLAKNNDISLAEARKLLSANELEEFHWTVQEYIKHGKENGISHDWNKQLENASARVHISRFDALKTQIRGELEKLNTVQTEGLNAHLSKTFTETYYRTAYEIQTGTGVGVQLNRFSAGNVERVLKRPWTPDKNTFRDRCWTNKEKLISELETGIAQTLIRGDSPDLLIRRISEKFGVEMHKAATLVATESAYFASIAEDECYRDLGVEEYEINAVLDSGTCTECGGLDGKVFDMKDHAIGATSPPFHPRCRCDKVPYFDDMPGERFARDDEGNAISVPGDMKYSEWKEKFVDTPKGKVYNDFIREVHEDIAENYNLSLNVGQQNKHIPGTNEYKTSGGGRSILTADPQTLIDLYAKTAIPKASKNWQWNHKTFFAHTEVIGTYNNTKGESMPTKNGTFHFAKEKGIHIVPANPEGLKNDKK